ncbi:MAG: hypothetical protein ACHP78_08230 [Terriglobales bacterium]
MKDINEVLRKKETDLQQLQRDVDALRVAVRILSEDAEAGGAFPRPAAAAVSYTTPARPTPPPAASASDAGYGAPWDAAGKKFP